MHRISSLFLVFAAMVAMMSVTVFAQREMPDNITREEAYALWNEPTRTHHFPQSAYDMQDVPWFSTGDKQTDDALSNKTQLGHTLNLGVTPFRGALASDYEFSGIEIMTKIMDFKPFERGFLAGHWFNVGLLYTYSEPYKSFGLKISSYSPTHINKWFSLEQCYFNAINADSKKSNVGPGFMAGAGWEIPVVRTSDIAVAISPAVKLGFSPRGLAGWFSMGLSITTGHYFERY